MRCKTLVSASLFALCVGTINASAGGVSPLTQACIVALYQEAFTYKDDANELLKRSKDRFDYGYAARVAASRNRLKWDKVGKQVQDTYVDAAINYARMQIIPKLQESLGVPPTFVREAVTKNHKQVVFTAGGLQTTFVMPLDETVCLVLDAKVAGASFSTLVAEKLKKNKN